MNIQALFKQSWSIWWNTRGLWVLGLITAFVGMSEYRVNASFDNAIPDSSFENVDSDTAWVQWLERFITELTVDDLWSWFYIGLVAFVVIGLLWTIFSFAMYALSQGAMVDMVDQVQRGQPSSVGTSLRSGMKFFSPVFWLNIILGLPVFILLAITFLFVFWIIWWLLSQISGSMVLSSLEDSTGAEFESIIGPMLGGGFCLLGLWLIIGLASAYLGLVAKIATRASVLEGLGTRDSISRGFQLVRANLGNSILVWFLLLALSILLNLILSVPLFILIVPLFTSALSGEAVSLNWLWISLFGLYGLIANIGFSGILTSYNATVWTLLYQSFVRPQEQNTLYV